MIKLTPIVSHHKSQYGLLSEVKAPAKIKGILIGSEFFNSIPLFSIEIKSVIPIYIRKALPKSVKDLRKTGFFSIG